MKLAKSLFAEDKRDRCSRFLAGVVSIAAISMLFVMVAIVAFDAVPPIDTKLEETTQSD